jgi:hypothetical protein
MLECVLASHLVCGMAWQLACWWFPAMLAWWGHELSHVLGALVTVSQ